MDAEELKIQRLRVRAELNMLKRRYDSGDASVVEKIRQVEIVLEGLVSYRPPSPLSGGEREEEKSKGNDNEFTPEQKEELRQLKEELQAIDRQKNRKINALAALPRNQNHRQEVQAIKAMREDYLRKSDEIYYFMNHGEKYQLKATAAAVESEKLKVNDNLDFESSEYWRQLPRDKVELNRLQLNTRSNLSKARGRQNTAKTEIKKADYGKKVSKLEVELMMIDNLIGML